MTIKRPLRVMWLINHTTLRDFELEQFKRFGVEEIFLPKCFPYDEGNLSASITYAEDKNLSITPEDLAVLNEQNWYEEPSQKVWEIANACFDLIVVAFFVRQLESAVRHFKGGIILRAFGLGGEETYSNLIRQLGGEALESAIGRCGKRFWFGMGYDHLAASELQWLKDRAVFLPIYFHGISGADDDWQSGFKQIFAEFSMWLTEQTECPIALRSSRKRIAVILSIEYRGGTFRGAQLLAHAIHLGSRQCGEPVDVVFLHIDNPMIYPNEEFTDLPVGIARRRFLWKIVPASEARCAMRYAGFEDWEPSCDNYAVIDDGIRQLQDCDLWLVVSDRMSLPLLPIKPVVVMIYDYLQRYVNIPASSADQSYLAFARATRRVIVTTHFTFNDAVQYAGVEPRRVMKLPMLAPIFPLQSVDGVPSRRHYFIWPTNLVVHKNHQNSTEALRIYYDELGGELECWVTGCGTQELLTFDLPHLKATAKIFEQSENLRRYVKLKGDLPDKEYRNVLSQAHFLWHAGRIDNGTFCVVEAACLGVPSLSSDYPAMREIEQQFSLNLAWMDPYSPRNMAEQLKTMEEAAIHRRTLLPDTEQLATQRVEALARVYWEGIRECL